MLSQSLCMVSPLCSKAGAGQADDWSTEVQIHVCPSVFMYSVYVLLDLYVTETFVLSLPLKIYDYLIYLQFLLK